MKLPYAEDLNYWQSGRSSPDTWISKAKKELARAGFKVLGDAYGMDDVLGRAAYMLSFQLAEDMFKVTWPVLPSRTGKDQAARIQAATMLYHDVKSRCVSAKVLGGRTAFFSYIRLPDGRSAADTAVEEILPHLFRPPMPMFQVVDK